MSEVERGAIRAEAAAYERYGRRRADAAKRRAASPRSPPPPSSRPSGAPGRRGCRAGGRRGARRRERGQVRGPSRPRRGAAARPLRCPGQRARARRERKRSRPAPPALREARRAAPRVRRGRASTTRPRPMALIGLDGHFKELNPAFTDLVGYSEAEFGAAVWPPVMDRANLPDPPRADRDMLAGTIESAEVKTGYVHAQGLLVPVVGSIRLVREDGEPRHFLLEADRRAEHPALVSSAVVSDDGILPWLPSHARRGPGARAARRAHPHRLQRSRRLSLRSRGAGGGARPHRRAGDGVPDARAGRLPAGQRHGARTRPRRPAGGWCRSAGSTRTTRRWPRPSAALAAGARGHQAAPARGGVRARPPRPAPRRSRWRTSAACRCSCHAGRGIPALGRHARRAVRRYPGVRLILAHAGISRPGLDLARRPRAPEPLLRHLVVVGERPARRCSRSCRRARSCWRATLPTARPPGEPRRRCATRCRSGLDHDQVRGVIGRPGASACSPARSRSTSAPPPGPARLSRDPLLDRVYAFLLSALGQMFNGVEPTETLALARLACEVGDDAPQAPVCRAVLALLDDARALRPRPATGARRASPRACTWSWPRRSSPARRTCRCSSRQSWRRPPG